MGYRHMTDEELARAAPGGGDAFAEMVRRSYNRVYLTALSITRQAEMAEDITQETFLRAWLKRESIKQPALLLQPWMIRIARNVSIDWLRTGQQRSRVLPLISMEELTVEPVDNINPNPRQVAGQAEQQGQLADAVMALPENLRQVVLLHYAEGMSPSDIARLNGEAASTVTRRLEKARAQLRQHLESGLAVSLAMLKPRPRQLEKTLGLLTAAVALPAASRAQLLQLVADTPPPPMIDPATLAAQAAAFKETGIMKSLIVSIGAGKLLAGAAVVAVVGGGAYTVHTFTREQADNPRAVQARAESAATRITALDSTGDVAAAGLSAKMKARSTGKYTGRLASGDNGKDTTNTDIHVANANGNTTAAEATNDFVTVKGIVSDVLTSQPLANAIVRAAAPADDMRSLREYKDAASLPSTRTDAAGAYELRVPLPAGAESLSLDAFSPGYRSLSGTRMSGGDFTKANIPVSRDQVLTENLDLPKALHVAGQVVDEDGEPVVGVLARGTLEYDKGMAFVADTSTDPNGRFEIFDYPEILSSYMAGRAGKITLSSTDRMSTSIPDIYKLTDAQRSSITIVMSKGFTLNGQLLEASGKPAADINLHIKYGESEGKERRDVVTDANGNFLLQGLPEGIAEIYARSMELDQRLKTDVTVPTSGDVTLSMVSTPYADTSKAVTLLGMKLIDVTPELTEKYDLYSTSGVLILDPGKEIERLEIGGEENPIGEGDQFWVAGNKRIADLKEFVGEILRVNTLPVSDGGITEGHVGKVRVVFNINRNRSDSSMTTYMRLTPEDIAELQKYINGG